MKLCFAGTCTPTAHLLILVSALQVYPAGVRLIRADGRHIDWKAPGTHTVTHAAVNQRQVAIALSNTEVVYFELDAAGQLNEHTERFNPGVSLKGSTFDSCRNRCSECETVFSFKL